MSKYAIWDKQTPILTPVGEVLSPAKWIERYPIASLHSITVICGAGEINGSFFGTLGQLVDVYTKQGCDLSACETAEDKVNAINAFIEAKEAEAKASNAAAKEQEASLQERQTAALEAIASGQTTENAEALDALLG